jgi:hypothetical protein
MDQEAHMSKNRPPTPNRMTASPAPVPVRDAETARKAVDLVALFKPRLKMADGWLGTLSRLHRYFRLTKRELRRNYKQPELFSDNRGVLFPLRMENEDYTVLDAAFGRGPIDDDTDMMDAPQESDSILSAPSSRAGEMGVASLLTPDSKLEGWNAINSLVQPAEGPNGQVEAYRANKMSPPLMPGPFPPKLPADYAYRPTHYNSLATAGDTAAPSQLSPAVSWTKDQAEVWLNNLETKFGADDVAAFVEGTGFKDLAGSGGNAGWLRLIWARK